MTSPKPRDASRWDLLKPAYRKRLESHGITRARYASGEPLTPFRGHGKTPEHPERATRNPERYQEYLTKKRRHGGPIPIPQWEIVYREVRTRLLDALDDDEIERLDIGTIREYIRKSPPDTLLEMQRKIRKLDEYQDKARYQQKRDKRRKSGLSKTPSQPWFIKIDDEWVNPFWYH